MAKLRANFGFLTAAGLFAIIFAIWQILSAIEISARATQDFSKPEANEALGGGAATSRKPANKDSFSDFSANLPFEKEMNFKLGNAMFRRLWVSAPASTRSADGLGPLFNGRACQRCHIKDGRGHPPTANWPDDNAISMLLRLSIPAEQTANRIITGNQSFATLPDPVYGGQLQDFALAGLNPEGRMQIQYAETPVTLSDGKIVKLRKPTYRVTELGYGPLHPKVMLSPRVAPPMIGLGLLEMIAEADILAHADPDDRNRDGISGQPQKVRDIATGKIALGRFGWKATNPNLHQQTADAFANDIGISSPLVPKHSGDCTSEQTNCVSAPNGAGDNGRGHEVSDQILDLVTFYSRNLAVPKRRGAGKPIVLQGKKIFHASGCAGCHVPKFRTRNDPKRPWHSEQTIRPYTDLLLHDMGEGLADNRPDGVATGREWRTPPLWGIGLTKTVSGHTFFLHDGRARNLLEAILWHGGEAEKARERVRALSKKDRDALIAFLNSL
ncbi:MAG: thiol oxidoreductase [Rhodospirillaceae bacterium]|nr:thiol oxidoreductase [Rhodospirillaceae bacterium]